MKLITDQQYNDYVNRLITDLTKLNGLEELRLTKSENLIRYHQTLGRDIRNEYGLWKDYDENSEDEVHPDDISMMIIIKCWERLQNEKEET